MPSTVDKRDNVDAGLSRESLASVLAKFRRGIELGLRVAAPGRVTQYDAINFRATVELGFNMVQETDDAEVPYGPILIPNARVAWVRTSGGHDVAPLAIGDTGLLVFTDRALDRWYDSPGAGAAVDPKHSRTHDLADAVFFPGLCPDATAQITPPIAANTRRIEAATIQLGAAATQAVALANLVAANFTTLYNAISAAPIGTADGGAAFQAGILAALAGFPASMAASKVVAE